MITPIVSLFLWFLIIPLVALVACVYFLPAIVAFSRNHPQAWVIALLTLIFGVTVVGWICLLLWAMYGAADHCLSKRLAEAKRLFDKGMISKEEYEHLRQRHLNNF